MAKRVKFPLEMRDGVQVRNIDELFTKAHMSAVVAGALMPGREKWKELNSGVMVIEPKNNLGNNIAKMINSVSLKKNTLEIKT